jgi:Protein of unknown function (DUF3298).
MTMELFNSKWMIGLGLGTILLTMLACGTGTPTVPTVTPPLLPTETSLPTATLPPLYLSVNLGAAPVKEQGPLPSYTIDAQVPVLQGSDDQRVTKFNHEMTLLIQQEISVFKDNVRELAPVPISNGSTFNGRYTLLSGPGNTISLKFDIVVSIAGTANRRTHSRTVTYDLEAGSDVSLAKLFRPGSTYLQVISNYCLAQLKPKIPNLVTSGVEATPSNYQNWNITPNGLLITFDENLVAATAQQVVIPYADLKEVIDPKGPLASFQP